VSTRNPGLDDVINEALEEALSELYVALPGVVQAYDPAAQKASVQPVARVAHRDEDGKRVVQALPVVNGVPVVFPGGGGFSVTFPIQAGDTVLLIFSGASLDKWKAGAGGTGGGGTIDPDFYSRHPIGDAIAIPGLRNFAAARATAPTDHVFVGEDGADGHGAAMGDRVKDYFDSIHAWAAQVQTALNGLGAPITPPLTAVPEVESSTVKVSE